MTRPVDRRRACTRRRSPAPVAAGRRRRRGRSSARAARRRRCRGRLAGKDATLWGPEAEAEASDPARLARRVPASAASCCPSCERCATSCAAEGVDHVVLAGMGGSSLAPEVICATAGVPLTVLDTTDPGQVRAALADRARPHGRGGAPARAAARSRPTATGGRSGRRSATPGIDPAERHRRRHRPRARRWSRPPRRGRPRGLPRRPGRRRPLQRADRVRAGARRRWPASTSPSCSTRPRRSRRRSATTTATRRSPSAPRSAAAAPPAATSSCSPTTAPASPGFGDWAEQLIAESTGKHGTGILPVVVERRRARARRHRADDVHVVRPRRRRRRASAPAVDGPLGAQFLAWEYATAVAGRVLRHRPVRPARTCGVQGQHQRDLLERRRPRRGQPGVRRRRGRGVRATAARRRDRPRRRAAPRCSPRSRDAATSPSWPTSTGCADAGAAASCARRWPRRTARPVTFGWGPRFLHSTGQYHKGGPQVGVVPADHRRGRRATSTVPGPAVHLRRAPGAPRPPATGRPAPPRPAGAAPAPDRPRGRPRAQLLRAADLDPRMSDRRAANPLRDPRDRRLPRIPEPCALVDLRGHRRPGPQEADPGRLRPGQPRAAAAGLRAARLRPPRLGRRRLRAAGPRGGRKEHARTPFREEVWQRLAEAHQVRARLVRRRRRLRHAGARRSTSCDDVARHQRQRRVLPVHPAGGVPDRAQADGAHRDGRQRERPAAGAGSWWRSRSATTWSRRSELNELVDERLHRAGRVPHRPLPRQGDGPEHPGAALRQHAVRADLELALRRLACRSRWPRTSASAAAPAFYDATGAARDVLQNHLLQLLALTAMEEPVSFDADGDPHREAQGARRRSRLPTRPGARTPSRGQYDQGWLAGERVGRATSRRRTSPPDSTTETYAAVRLGIETRRWAGVPFYLRTGKRLPRRVTEIAVVFKKAPHLPFNTTDTEELGAQPAGHPGAARRGRDAEVRVEGAGHARWRSATSRWTSCTARRSPSPARRRTSGCCSTCCSATRRCSRTTEEVEASWRVIDPLEELWAEQRQATPEPYRAGEWGPRGGRRDAGPRRPRLEATMTSTA